MKPETNSVNWLNIEQLKSNATPAIFEALSDFGSLTQKTRTTCEENAGSQFTVQLVSSKPINPAHEETHLLKLSPSDLVLSREVFLRCDKTKLIFARTLIGLNKKTDALSHRIQTLGEQSLGSILFADPLAEKRSMHYAKIAAQHGFFHPHKLATMKNQPHCWVRRCLYDYQGSALLLYEAFLSLTTESNTP